MPLTTAVSALNLCPEENYILKVTKIANVERTEVPTCVGCIPPTHTQTKVITKFRAMLFCPFS